MPGTVADGVSKPVPASPAVVVIEHPMGEMEVTVTYTDGPTFRSAGLIRTARLIARGEVMVETGPHGWRMKTYDMIARAVAQEGVTDAFALLGDANMNFATRLSETGCRMIYVRHEHCAAAAAMAYARKTGRTGFATVTCGPGLTQLMTALPAAVRARLPMVVLAGEAPLKSGWYNQAIDQAPLRGRDRVRISRAASARADAAADPRCIRTGGPRKRRPVGSGHPLRSPETATGGAGNLAHALGGKSHRWCHRCRPTPTTSPVAADIVAGSRRVIVMAGMGAVEAGAGPACRALAERIGRARIDDPARARPVP